MTTQEPRKCCDKCSHLEDPPCRFCPCHNPGKEERDWRNAVYRKAQGDGATDFREVPQEPQPVEEWEREFDKTIHDKLAFLGVYNYEEEGEVDVIIKSFIRQILSSDRERVRAVVSERWKKLSEWQESVIKSEGRASEMINYRIKEVEAILRLLTTPQQ